MDNGYGRGALTPLFSINTIVHCTALLPLLSNVKHQIQFRNSNHPAAAECGVEELELEWRELLVSNHNICIPSQDNPLQDNVPRNSVIMRIMRK